MVAITKSLCFSFIILASFATLFALADARRIYVGGNGVWAVNPQESYNTWAGRNRFQVNDTLYFKYAKGSDSVQRVTNVDFDGCNVRNPLKSFDNGEAEVALNRSGPFYFISGNQDHCFKGQKLIVVVLAVRKTVPISPANPPKSHSPVSPIAPAKPPSTAQPPKSYPPVSPAKPPSTAQPPKPHSPVSPIAPAKPPSTAQPPKSPSPVSPAKSPKSPSPVSPVSAPSTSQPPKSSVSPTQPPPSSSPVTHSPAVSPSHAPTISPDTPSPPKSPSPSTSSPANPPTSEQSPPLSPSPSKSTPPSDNIKAPAPSPKNAAGGVAVTSVMTTVLSVAFTVLIFA